MPSPFLPTTKKEMEALGWDQADVILLSGDAYVDHPSFGAAVIARVLEHEHLRVCVVPQPNWRDDLRDFKKLGRPRLFFGVTAGCMDSMVNKYTANKRLRHEDAYTPDGRTDLRPEYPSIVYSRILKDLFPDVPVILGGIEASMRRLSHYDYWQDTLRESILVDSGADLLIYGMGELPIKEIARRILQGQSLEDVPQTARLCKDIQPQEDDIVLFSHQECLQDKKKQAANFRHIEEESNKVHAQRILQKTLKSGTVVVNAPYPPMTSEQLDASYDLPYTRLPHPRYRGKRIPAYDMIKFSVTLHRGCFGGCAFCTISAHQGKFIASRSKESILREVRHMCQMPDFKGVISDLGGPSANMYRMGGENKELCQKCKRPSCLHPRPCPNLNNDHGPLLDILRSVDKVEGVRKSFIGSGIRYDLAMHESKDEDVNRRNREYLSEVITRHVSGRLKVAPEHTADRVLDIMRKPSFTLFKKFKRIFDEINHKAGLNQQIIPYFISSHPGCTEEDMAELAAETKLLDFHLEQVQDFTPTPMTISTETWYTGFHPYTLESVFSAKSPKDKLLQRMFFFWYDPKERASILQELRKMNRPDLQEKLYGTTHGVPNQVRSKGAGRTPGATPRHAFKGKRR